MTPKRAFLFICFLLMASLATAKQGYVSSKHVLENGMPVVVTEMPGNPMVSVYCLIKAGAATEGPFLGSGISHFVEHMLFKSTEKFGVGEIATKVQSLGGDVNASTSLDFTIYTLTVPADKFDEALDIVADMVSAAKFDPEEVEKERTVILREMDLHNDNPNRRISRLSLQNVFIKHPYRHPTIGYKDLFNNISQDDLYQYYKTQYIPNNMVFSVAGDVRAEDIFPRIQERFKDFKRVNYPARVLEEEPDQVTPRYAEDEFDVPHVYMSMAFPSVRLMDKDLYALDVLAHILGKGSTSRLTKDLYYDRQLVFGVGSSNFTPVDKGAFEVEAQLKEENFPEVKEIILQHIRRIQEKGVDVEELEKAKIQVRADYLINHQHTSSIAWSQALDEAFTGSHDFSAQYVKQIAKLEPKDIQRVARQYLLESSMSIALLKPLKKDKEDIVEKQENAAPEIHKYVLENGLTVLLRANPAFDFVALRLSMEGGSRQEDQEKQGLSNLTGHLWVKGTKKRSRESLYAFTESKGIRFGFISGRNSLGLYMNTLPEYLEDAVALFKELVLTPSFPANELNQVVKNTKQSLKVRDTQPYALTQYELQQLLFPTHPFGRDPKGTQESLDQIQRKDIEAFYAKLRKPKNMVLTILGNFKEEELLERIKKDYSKLPAEDANILTFSENPLDAPREKVSFLDKDQAVVILGFHGPTLYDEDYYAARVTGAILGSSFSGRMFSNIRDKLSKAYTLGGGLSAGLDAGLFSFYASTTDENVETVVELLKKEIKDLQENLVSDEELDVMKTYLKGTHKSGLQTDFQLIGRINLDELYGLGYDDYRNYDAYIDQVTKEDIQRIARQYWDLNKAAVSITRPTKSSEAEDLSHEE